MKTNQLQKNIPNGWQQVKLADICVFKKGKGLPKSDLVDNGKYEAIHYGELFTKYHEKIETILSKTNNNKSVFLSKKNDVLMPTSDVTPRGLSTASFINKDGVILGGDVLVIRPKNDILNGLFFSNFITAQKKKVMQLVSGTTVFHLYGSDMARLKFNLPPLSEQNRIVSVFETWDKAIKNLNKKIEIKKQIKKGLMQDLLTGKKRLAGFKDKWEKIILENTMDSFSTGLNPRDNFKLGFGNNYYVTIKNISNGSLDFSNAELVDNDALRLINKRSKLSKNDIIMASIGNVGECYLLIEDPKGWDINESVFCLKPNTKIIDPQFIYYVISSNYTKRYFENNITGSSFRSIKMKELRNMPFSIPKLAEQKEITKILATADKEITELEKKLSIIKDQKKFLLNNLITGAIRTPENLKVN